MSPPAALPRETSLGHRGGGACWGLNSIWGFLPQHTFQGSRSGSGGGGGGGPAGPRRGKRGFLGSSPGSRAGPAPLSRSPGQAPGAPGGRVTGVAFPLRGAQVPRWPWHGRDPASGTGLSQRSGQSCSAGAPVGAAPWERDVPSPPQLPPGWSTGQACGRCGQRSDGPCQGPGGGLPRQAARCHAPGWALLSAPQALALLPPWPPSALSPSRGPASPLRSQPISALDSYLRPGAAALDSGHRAGRERLGHPAPVPKLGRVRSRSGPW